MTLKAAGGPSITADTTCRICGTKLTVEVSAATYKRHNGNVTWRACDDCNANEAAERERTIAAEYEEIHANWLRERWRRRIGASGIPRKLVNPTLTAPPHDAMKAAVEFANGTINGLLFTGPPGLGKTTIAGWAFARRLQHTPGIWRSAPILVNDLQAEFGSDERRVANELLSGRQMVALDDLDKARGTDYAASQIFAAINEAYVNEQPLVVTSNLPLQDLARRWPQPIGETIADRLQEHCVRVVLTGATRRKPAQLPTQN